MAQQLGGKVEPGKVREFGYAEVRARHTRLLDGIEDLRTPEGHGVLKVWMSHGDKVVDMPPGFKLMASNEACPIAGMADEARRFYGVQFHPEVTHTLQGKAILRALRLRHLRLRRRLEHAGLRRRGGRAHPRAGGRRRGDPGPVGRRRFLGRGGAHPQGDRQAAHVRIRRSRPVAPERSAAGDGDFREAHARESHSRRCCRRVLCGARRA